MLRKFWTMMIILALGAAASPSGAAERLLGPLTQFPPAFAAQPPAAEQTTQSLLLDGYQPGLGAAIISAGRFGFSKGDGLLDLSYPFFGKIEKPELADHPDNAGHKPWAITFDPPGAKGRAAEKRPYYHYRDQQGDVRANWISTVWDSHLVAETDFAGRKRGAPIHCRVTYSLASPGILLETDDHGLRLGLGQTAGYRSIVLPLASGLVERELTDTQGVYRQASDGALADNWVLLWPAAEFPAVPVLVVLKQSPSEIQPLFTGERLDALDLVFPAQVGHVILATPLGIGALRSEKTTSPEPLGKAIRLCRFWSKALLAYITHCQEYFKIDEATGGVSIVQRYEYRLLADAWQTSPVRVAPYPPALALAAQICDGIKLPSEAVDLEFPTKYGPLKALVGRGSASYRLPEPPAVSRIPLAPAEGSPARREIRQRQVITRPAPDRPLAAQFHPGFWSRPGRPIADAVSMLGERALLAPWLDPASRQALQANARDFLIDCLDDQALFAQTALFQGIEHTPQSAGKLQRPLWFPRTEPYTQKTYWLSYTIPPVRTEGKNITDYPGAFTDLDWGNGLGLLGIWQLARAGDGWDLIRKHWPLIKGIYALFEVLQDWACMSASGNESGSRWTDTSCYGAYPAFRKMAEAVGDREAARAAAYLHAKHAAMRLALMTAGRFYPAFCGGPPWMVCHQFREAPRPGWDDLRAFQMGNTRLTAEEVRGENPAVQKFTLYSLVAEGTGTEAPDLFYRWVPRATSELLRRYRELYPDWNTAAFCKALNARHSPMGGITAYQMMLFEIGDPEIDTATLRRHWRAIRDDDLLRRFLKPMYGRWIAAHEYAQALVETRDDPAWLADWQNAAIRSAEFDPARHRAVIGVEAAGGCRVELGGKPPRRVTLDGRELPPVNADADAGWRYRDGLLRLALPHGGELAVDYE